MTTYYGPPNIQQGKAGFGTAAIGLAAPVGLTASQALAPLYRPSDGRPEESVSLSSTFNASFDATRRVNNPTPRSAPGSLAQPPVHQHHHSPPTFLTNRMSYGAPQNQGYQYAGGYNGNRPQAPMNMDPQILSWFNAVDRDGSGSISARELQSALMNGDNTNFDIDTVRMLMSLFDVDRSGTINLQEFGGVWTYIKQWQDIFRRFDRDYSGTMDEQELQSALAQLGYPLPPYTIGLMQQKYRNTRNDEAAPMRPGGLTFGHFIRVCVAVKTLTDSFRRLDPQGQGTVFMHYNQFLDLVFSGP